MQVDARKLIVSGDDLPGGLVRLVADHGVAELVMGAAADRAYSRKMRAPKSKKAAAVKLMANPSCRIWFVCKGKLICTREASDEGLMSRGEPSTASTSPRPTASDDGSTSKSSSSRHGGGGAEPAGMECQRDKSFLDGEKSVRSDQGDASEMEDQQTRRPPEAAEEPMPAAVDGDQGVDFLRLGLPELEEATGRFDESARIGSAGIGRAGVYRGSLRGMSVAVTVISPDVAVGEARFAREVEAIAKVRHPGLVQLVGACPEARAVVHELVPGGSLEDRLAGKAPPLPWHARCGVAYRTCSALAYLHSTATVHGDVRPANILLDDERCSSSKLAGLGMPGLVVPPQLPSGVALAYVDPRYLATGELTPQCDVHALGVVLLRLVTGMPAFAAKKAAQKAAEGSTPWHEVVDASAGGWPMERATEVALLGLKCCDAVETGGPRRAGELLDEALGVLEAATNATPGRTWSSLSASTASDSGGAPSYFLCPILKEVMRDPQIAGDGFTYEAGAMKEWLGSGHDTSPMTNLKLPTDELMPNHALRAAIQEWRHTRPSTFHRHL